MSKRSMDALAGLRGVLVMLFAFWFFFVAACVSIGVHDVFDHAASPFVMTQDERARLWWGRAREALEYVARGVGMIVVPAVPIVGLVLLVRRRFLHRADRPAVASNR